MSDIENLSTAFKHINLYEILEPQRVHNVQVGTLVDISDDNNKPNEELIGSFIDKVTKPKFDILDVYENIYVTPQHLEPQRKNDLDLDIFIREDSSNDEVDSLGNVACANIQTDRNKAANFDNSRPSDQMSFPKLHRFDEKSTYKDFLDDILKTKANLDENDIKKSVPTNEAIYSAMKYSEDLRHMSCSTEKNKDFLFSLPTTRNSEDLLTKELFDHKIESNSETFDLSLASDVPIYRNLQQIPKKEGDFSFLHKGALQNIQFQNSTSHKLLIKGSNNCLPELSNAICREEFIEPKIKLNIGKSANINKIVEREDPNTTFFKNLQDFQNPLRHDLKKLSEKSKDNLYMVPNEKVNFKTVQTVQNLVENKNFSMTLYQYNIKCSIIDENKVIKSLMHPPIPMLQIVRLDKKLFAKRIIKSESELSRYTKGPDLYEKSLVLPQIMARLMVKNKNVEQKKWVRRKYILDSPNTGEPEQEPEQVFEMPKLVTEIIVKDRNKERLKALQVRRSFDEFVKFGKF